jgi:dethiobiotin synthetase
MSAQIWIITGTDTGVGKTVFTAWLARFLRDSGVETAVCKPLCSGGRDDARLLRGAVGKSLTLDEINPWYFRAPLAPLLAARAEGQGPRLSAVVAHLHALTRRCDVLLVEGAGGLLSPLGEGFDTRDLIPRLRMAPVIVAANRLGVINSLRLTLEALPIAAARRARIVLMNPRRPDAASRTNAALLGEFFDPARILVLPWVASPISEKSFRDRRVRTELEKHFLLV